MKRTIIIISLMAVSAIMYGQAREGYVLSQKKQQPAAVIELPYPQDVVMNSLNDHLSRKGRSRSTDIKGFTTFRNTSPTVNDSVNADMYFKVERKSRQEKGITIVSMLINSPNEALANDSNRYLGMEQAKQYLNELVPAIAAYNLELVIKEQNESLVKAESKLKSLESEGKDLEEKRGSINKKIADNIENRKKQAEEIEAQKAKLAASVSQRKN